MEIFGVAVKAVIAIGVIGGGALTMNSLHVSQADFDQFAGSYAASNYVRDLISLGAEFDDRGRVRCSNIKNGRDKRNCVYVRQQYYDLRPPRKARQRRPRGRGR